MNHLRRTLLVIGLCFVAIDPCPAQVPDADRLDWPAVGGDDSLFPPVIHPTPSLPLTGPVVDLAALSLPDPFDLTIEADLVTVTDLFSGVAVRLSFGFAPVATVPSPSTGTTTGIAFDVASSRYFWIDATADLLIATDSGGVVDTVLPVGAPSGGVIGGLTFDATNSTLWAVDVQGDLLFEIDPITGVATGRSQTMPGATSKHGALGLGVAARDSDGALFAPAGSLAEGGPVRLCTFDPAGPCSGASATSPLTDGPGTGLADLDRAVRGVAWHPSFTTSSPTLLAIGGSTRTIYALDVSNLECSFPPPCDLSCTVTSAGVVELAWMSRVIDDLVEIVRDGAVVGVAGPATTTFVDSVPPGQVVEYELRAQIGGDTCLGPRCRVRVPSDLQLSVTLSGGTPYGVTVVESIDEVWVVELDGGVTHRFARDLTPIGSFPSPTGTSRTTGVAYRESTDTVYWIDATNTLLLETSTAGNLLSTVPLELPGEGVPGGLALTCDASALILVDIEDDAYSAIGFDGAALDPEAIFLDPEDMENAGSFGNGVARMPGGDGYVISIGCTPQPSRGPVRLVRTDCAGGLTDTEFELGPDAIVDDAFTTGIAVSAVPLAGSIDPTLYIVGQAECRLFAFPIASAPGCTPPSDLSCTIVGSNVELSWTNPESYANVTVTRNCVDLDTEPGTTESYVDTSPLSGSNWYTVSFECTNGSVVETSCHLCYDVDSDDAILDKDDRRNGDVDSTEALKQALEANGRSVAVYEDISGKDISGYDSLWITLGTYPANNRLTASEGQKVADFLALGKPVYIEGAEVWGFDPPTALFDLDGVDGRSSDGNPIDDGDDTFVGMVGSSGGALDLTGFDAAYTQDQAGDDSTDRLVPTGTAFALDVPGEGAVEVWLDDGSGGATTPYATGIAYAPLGGSGRVIAVSWEFGGYGGDRVALAARYLDFFGLRPVPFIRGDFTADGAVDIGDAVALLGYLFLGSSTACAKAGDIGDDGLVNIGDAIALLDFLFAGGPAPAPPHPTCGPDGAPDLLPCTAFPPCP
ncbi:MAG: dockerin type I repeat-containing protein [Planctomycetes bacterium]|nr:dockerin type I repeat-containing protein [Planctomycetota bacterium]